MSFPFLIICLLCVCEVGEEGNSKNLIASKELLTITIIASSVVRLLIV